MARWLYKLAPWAAAFCCGLAAGAALHGELAAWVRSALLEMGVIAAGVSERAGELGLFLLIFGNNTFVAVLCFALGRPSRGLFPAAVCALNGALAGAAVPLVSRLAGIPMWKLTLILVPHGVPEFTALFWACSLGVGEGGLKRRLVRFCGPVALFALAAAVEVFFSARLARFIFGRC